eukprot:scaffold1352_cov261-Pinguiococcus_pyrenoidosus.AAC.14
MRYGILRAQSFHLRTAIRSRRRSSSRLIRCRRRARKLSTCAALTHVSKCFERVLKSFASLPRTSTFSICEAATRRHRLQSFACVDARVCSSAVLLLGPDAAEPLQAASALQPQSRFRLGFDHPSEGLPEDSPPTRA